MRVVLKWFKAASQTAGICIAFSKGVFYVYKHTMDKRDTDTELNNMKYLQQFRLVM
jgi:hypothetical protein